jgi:hypothetical protein
VPPFRQAPKSWRRRQENGGDSSQARAGDPVGANWDFAARCRAEPPRRQDRRSPSWSR